MRVSFRIAAILLATALSSPGRCDAGGPSSIVSDTVRGRTSVPAASSHTGPSHSFAATGSDDVGLFVWTVPRVQFDPEIAEDRARLLAAATAPGRKLARVYLSNYRGGSPRKMHAEAALASLLRSLHDAGVEVYALYTELNLSAGPAWNFFGHVAEYNAGRRRASERFAGVAMNWEGGGADGKDPTKDVSHFAAMRAEADRYGLRLHQTMRHWWDARNVGSDVFKAIIDNADAVNVMAYSSNCHAAAFVRDEVAYASSKNVPLYVSLETMDIGTRGGAAREETFRFGGEKALFSCMRKTINEYRGKSAKPAGFLIHMYLDSYSSGDPGWPVIGEK